MEDLIPIQQLVEESLIMNESSSALTQWKADLGRVNPRL